MEEGGDGGGRGSDAKNVKGRLEHKRFLTFFVMAAR